MAVNSSLLKRFIIVQRGTKFHPGLNVGIGKDDTLFAKSDGFVAFEWSWRQKAGERLR